MTVEPYEPRLRIDALSWVDVDPDLHPFDPGTVLDVVRAVAPAGGVPAPYRYDPARGFDRVADDARWDWQRAMTVALVEHYGRWACGWGGEVVGRTADGALVLRWSGARDSITTPQETLAAVAGALLDWRTFLEDLTVVFRQYLPLPGEPRAAAAAWEATFASLVAMVAARSGADEHWYGICALTLKWFLFVAGVPGENHDTLVDEAIGGRFWSSVSPLGAEVIAAVGIIIPVGERLIGVIGRAVLDNLLPTPRNRGKARTKKNPTSKYGPKAGTFPHASLNYTINTHVTIMEGLTTRSKR